MVDPEIVGERLRYINEYTNDLKRIRGLSKKEHTVGVVTQRAVERTSRIHNFLSSSDHLR